jgi:hypothetical protein
MAGFLWASDKITLDGERTVYTVECHDGTWQGTHCSGELKATNRYRFRALKAHREVVFWTAGAGEPSGRFTDCDIQDGRNWTCQPMQDAQRTITLQLNKGKPVPDASGVVRPFHAIAKWRWYLLRSGIPVGGGADN